jgi:glycine/D-amino acid oxidase-like deaminating enzyme
MKAADPASYDLSWYAATMVPASARGQLTIDLDVDVCVIGGGLAGLTTAREVARRGWSVAVLEASSVASGASGRNCGFVLPGFAERIDRIISRVGLENTKSLWALSERGLDYVRATIRDTRMKGVDPVDGWLFVSKLRDAPSLAAEATQLREEFGAQVEYWPAGKVRQVLKSPLYHNAAHFPRAFHIHPLNYALGLAEAAEKAGARIFENTPALSIDPSGIRKRVITPSARVRAAHIVLAANTGLGGLMPRIAATLMPITTYVATTAQLGPRLAEVVAYSGGVTDTERADNHYRIVDGDRLLWAGGMTTWESDPRRFTKRLAADIRRTFPQLGEVAIEHIWSGTLGNAVHKMPQIGEISRGLWLASAFGGHGFNTTAMAGELIARGIVEGDQTWRLFSPYDLVWAGGVLGRAALQVGYWSKRLVEVVEANMARAHVEKSAAKAAQETSSLETPAQDIVPPPQHPAALSEAVVSPTETGPVAAESEQDKVPRRKRAARPRKAAASKQREKSPEVAAGQAEPSAAADGEPQPDAGSASPEKIQPRAKQSAEGPV